MSQTIKVLTVSDLHMDKRLVRQLAKAIRQHKPDILAVVGDFLDATPFEDDKLGIGELAGEFSRFRVGEIIFVRGNHEDSAIWLFEQEFEAAGKTFHLLDRKAFVFGPLVIIGFPCLMGCFDNLIDPISSQPHKWLPPLLRRYGTAARTLWLMHEPPMGTELSRREGVLSGNFEWIEAVERFSPWLVVFGHDHETPVEKGVWRQTLPNGTMCLNVGQDSKLHFAVIQLEFADHRPCLPSRVSITAYPKGETTHLPLRS